jgi:hypothetical protein
VSAPRFFVTATWSGHGNLRLSTSHAGDRLTRAARVRVGSVSGGLGEAPGPHDMGETFRDRKPWPPIITSVHRITRKGIGVSPRPSPVAAMANAVKAPIPTGSSNTHRLWTAVPTSKAIARIRMIVMRGRVTRTVMAVQLRVGAPKLKIRATRFPVRLRISESAGAPAFARRASKAANFDPWRSCSISTTSAAAIRRPRRASAGDLPRYGPQQRPGDHPATTGARPWRLRRPL